MHGRGSGHCEGAGVNMGHRGQQGLQEVCGWGRAGHQSCPGTRGTGTGHSSSRAGRHSRTFFSHILQRVPLWDRTRGSTAWTPPLRLQRPTSLFSALLVLLWGHPQCSVPSPGGFSGQGGPQARGPHGMSSVGPHLGVRRWGGGGAAGAWDRPCRAQSRTACACGVREGDGRGPDS